MKLLKTQKAYITNRIRDNLILMKYSNEQKKEELIQKNEELKIQLTELKKEKKK